jgi:hypothetical protein
LSLSFSRFNQPFDFLFIPMKAWPFDLNAVAGPYLLIADGERLSFRFGIFWVDAVGPLGMPQSAEQDLAARS